MWFSLGIVKKCGFKTHFITNAGQITLPVGKINWTVVGDGDM